MRSTQQVTTAWTGQLYFTNFHLDAGVILIFLLHDDK